MRSFSRWETVRRSRGVGLLFKLVIIAVFAFVIATAMKFDPAGSLTREHLELHPAAPAAN